MKTLNARQIVKKEYGNSKNVMTPNVIKYGKINKYIAYELSSGEGIKGEPIFGVSFVEVDDDGNTIRRTDLSSSFSTIEEANEYITRLKYTPILIGVKPIENTKEEI